MAIYIQTTQGLHVHLKGRVRTISSGDKNYEDVLEAVKRGADEAEITEIMERELRAMQAAVEALNRDLTDDVKVRGGQVLYRGKPIHNSLTERMIQQLSEGFDLVPMAKFLANLMENPSYRAVNDLYRFLEHGKMPITPDGCFLAYKAVREDFKDIYTGTYDNTPGRPEPVWMPRNGVDEDPNRTCSHGFHVCSFEYLPHFSHANGHVVICKVDPRDVVAIPADYHDTKMRVCRYWVIEEYPDYYTKHEDRLSQTSIAAGENAFRIDILGTEPDTESYASFAEAARRAADLLEFDSTESVKVTNTATGVVIFQQANEDYVPADENDLDDEDDEEETDSFDVIYFETKVDLDNNQGTVYVSDVEDLDEAMESMFEAYREISPHAARVVDTRTGEVKKTIS